MLAAHPGLCPGAHCSAQLSWAPPQHVGSPLLAAQVTYTAPRRPDWKQGFQIDPQSVRIITLQAALHAEQGAAAV